MSEVGEIVKAKRRSDIEELERFRRLPLKT